MSREGWGRKDWFILLGLLVLAVAAWSKVIFSRQWSYGVELDFIRQFYPARVYAAQSLASGTFPLWNPYLLSGHPFFASYQTAMLYPPNLLMVGLYGVTGSGFSLKAQCGFVVFHFYLAGVFTYLLGRELKLGRVGATIAAVTYMFSGYLVAHAGHMNQQSAAAWIPLVFFLFYRCLDRRKISYSVAAGAALGIALLAGHLQPMFYLCLLLGMLVVYMAVRRRTGEPDRPGLPFGLAALGCTVIVAGALAAVQLIPTYQLVGLSSRRNIPFELAATYSLPRRQLITLVFPHFYGPSPTGYMGGWVMWEMYGYAGIVAGALGVVALLRRRRGFVIFLWVVLILSIILALGPGGYLFTALFRSHLLFDRFRDPARTLVIFGFASALLAGFGAKYLIGVVSDPERRPRFRSALKLVWVLLAVVLALVLAISIFLIARGPGRSEHTRVALRSMVIPTVLLLALAILLLILWRKQTWKALLPIGLVVLVVVDLVVLNVPWTMVKVDPDDIFADKAASRYLESLDGVFRVETDANTMYRSLDNGPLYDLEKASGDDSLVLMDYYRYRELVVPSVSPGVQLGLFSEGGLRSPLLDIMNDVYFMTREEINPVLTEGKFEPVRYAEGVFIYENVAAMPRAWMSNARVLADSEEVFDEVSRTGGEGLNKEALVVADEESGLEPGDSIDSVEGEVEVLERAPHSLKLRTGESLTGLLVVSEVLYPGWEVYVDGEKKRILETNFLYRGVLLEGGQEIIEFRFEPGSVRAGMVVSIITAGLLLLYLLALLFLRRKTRFPEGDDQG